MKRSTTEIKRLARENLMGNFRIMAYIFIIAYCLPMMVEIPFSNMLAGEMTLPLLIVYLGGEILITVIANVLSIGEILTHLCLARKQIYGTRDVLYCFRYRSNHYFIGAMILTVFSILSMVPLFIGTFLFGDISKLSGKGLLLLGALGLASLALNVFFQLFLGLFPFVLLDQEEDSVWQCFKKAIALTKGRRGLLLSLYLSFIGMWILSVISMGIGFLFAVPYLYQSLTVYYLDGIGEEPAPRY